jgi:hypothetical protein
MKFVFTEKELGKGYQLLETLVAQQIAMELALTAVIQYSPRATGHVQALQSNVGEILLQSEMSDHAIQVVQQTLSRLTTPES